MPFHTVALGELANSSSEPSAVSTRQTPLLAGSQAEVAT